MRLSIVIPVRDEAESVASLWAEVRAALAALGDYEVLFVDDGSRDGTADVVRACQGDPRVRLLRHPRPFGQSAALYSGVIAAEAGWIGTLDGDGQDDPADLAAFLARLDEWNDPALKLVIGHRVTRRDPWARRLESRIANRLRSALLGDATPDTGCGTKLFHRETFLGLPFFDPMHSFLPALFQRAGARVVSVPVRHRPRRAGRSKYGMHDRLWGRLIDLFGVMWLQRRGVPGLHAVEEQRPPDRRSAPTPAAVEPRRATIRT